MGKSKKIGHIHIVMMYMHTIHSWTFQASRTSSSVVFGFGALLLFALALGSTLAGVFTLSSTAGVAGAGAGCAGRWSAAGTVFGSASVGSGSGFVSATGLSFLACCLASVVSASLRFFSVLLTLSSVLSCSDAVAGAGVGAVFFPLPRPFPRPFPLPFLQVGFTFPSSVSSAGPCRAASRTWHVCRTKT